MVIAGFVIGLLSVTVFWWLGVTLGGLLTAGVSVDAVLTGGASSLNTAPLWIVGLGVGVGLPVVSVVLSSLGLAKGQSKGIGLVGIVTGAIGAILGLGFTLLMALGIHWAESAKDLADEPTAPAQRLEEMQETLNDPAFQEKIMKAMAAAAANQSSPASDATDESGAIAPTDTKPVVAPSDVEAPAGGAAATHGQ